MNEKFKKILQVIGAFFVGIFSLVTAFVLGRKLSDNGDGDTTNRAALDRLGEASDRIEGNTKDIRGILAEVRKRKVED